MNDKLCSVLAGATILAFFSIILGIVIYSVNKDSKRIEQLKLLDNKTPIERKELYALECGNSPCKKMAYLKTLKDKTTEEQQELYELEYSHSKPSRWPSVVLGYVLGKCL